MCKPNFKRNFIMLALLCLSVVAIGVVSAEGAANSIRPANPLMDYAPQNLGIYDTYYDNFYESDCRSCHGATTALIHHNTQHALSNDCLFCHEEYPQVVPPVRDCKVCHNDGWTKHPGKYGFPHHRSDYANSDQCTKCHDSNLLDETNTVEPPGGVACNDQSIPGCTTPTPYSCENCHWPSGLAPNQASTYPDETPAGDDPVAEFLTDWTRWITIPKPTTFLTGQDPQSIEANGPVRSGTLWGAAASPPLVACPGGPPTTYETRYRDNAMNDICMPDKPYRPFTGGLLEGTHHMVKGKVYPKCGNCHGTNPDSDPSYDPNNPYLIRMCENCHTVRTLHAIAEHVTNAGGPADDPDDYGRYTQGGVTDIEVSANNKCVACHGDNLGTLPDLPTVMPTILRIVPNDSGLTSLGSPGITVNLFPDTSGGKPDFGLKNAEDVVILCGNNTYGVYIEAEAPIYDWDPSQIQFKIPGWKFASGQNLGVKVRKLKNYLTGETGDSTNTPQFVLNKHPEINSLTPPSGPYETEITIKGVGFGTESLPHSVGYPNGEVFAADGAGNRYGYRTYVELTASNDVYRVTNYPDKTPPVGAPAWGPTQIGIKLVDLMDLNTGKLVPPDQLYLGVWNVQVVTDYFKDNGNGAWAVEILGDGVGNDNGICEGGEKCDIDTGDTVIWSERSDPASFTANDLPFISSVVPYRVKYGKQLAIYGYNFKPTAGKVRLYKGASYQYVTVVSWSNTLVTVIVDKYRPPVADPRQSRTVMIERADGKLSKKRKLVEIR